MAKKQYISRIEKPTVHTTSKGISYVTAFDVVRSKAGREMIQRHAAMSTSQSRNNEDKNLNKEIVKKAGAK